MIPRPFPHNQHSIRWRLPLSYAGIALLTALALGGLLLLTLNRYYDAQERRYLRLSARMLAGQVEAMYRDELGVESIQSSVNLFSFLARARVQLMDSDGQIVADSGPVSEQTQVNVHFRQQETNDLQPYSGNGSGEPYLSVRDEPPPEPPDNESGFQETGPRYPLNVRTGPFGQLLYDTAASGEYSDQYVTVPVYGPSGDVLAYLGLSEGPALGNEIVSDVAEKSVVAGTVAVLIAAIAGVIVSRGISRPVLALADVTRHMAQGNLAIRAQLDRQDEFGLLADTFNIMAERVEATVGALRQFVADAAHEINTPLTALRTNLELLPVYDLSPVARSDIQQALAELNRLEMLTRNLLVLARLEAPDVTTRQHTPVDLTLLARQMYERYASRAEQAEITFCIQVPEDSVYIQANREQMIRMLDNLLDNALKFTPRQGQVTLGLHVKDNKVHVWVQDTGIGVPESDLPKLFSRFHRGHNAAAYPGNGLGLAITRAIVADHGGQIVAESSGQGTRFSISLPYEKQEGTHHDDISYSAD